MNNKVWRGCLCAFVFVFGFTAIALTLTLPAFLFAVESAVRRRESSPALAIV